MFNSIVYELQNILNESGKEFVVFPNYVLDAAQGDELINKYENVGILYVNYGALRLMTGNKGMTGSMQLDLIMEVEDGVKMDEIVQRPLQALMSHTNGKIMEIEGKEDGELDWEKEGYNYVLVYHLPTTNGDVKYTSGGKKFVVYSLLIDVYLTSGLIMGESVEIKLDGATINNIVNCTIAPSVQVEPRTMLNHNKTVVDGLSSAWGIQFTIMFAPNDATHKALYQAIVENPLKVWHIEINDGQLKSNGENTQKYVLLQECPIAFQRAQPSMLSISAVETMMY